MISNVGIVVKGEECEWDELMGRKAAERSNPSLYSVQDPTAFGARTMRSPRCTDQVNRHQNSHQTGFHNSSETVKQ